MRQPLVLAVSILLNVLCAGYIGYSTLVADRADARGGGALARPSVSAEAAGDADWQGMYERARSAGLSELDAQYLLRGRIEAQRSAAHSDVYWRPASVREYELQSTDGRLLQEARAALVKIIGQSAPSSPALIALFRPLDPKASFLSSEKQIALQEMQQQALAQSVQRSAPIGATSAGGAGFFSKSVLEQAQTLLSADEMLEFELRFSPTAARLANVAPNLSEAQFRDAYGLLRDADQSGQSRQRLRELLGEPGLGAFSRAGNPAELALANVIRKHGISSGNAAAAMEVMRSAHTGAALKGSVTLESGAATELRRLIGDDAYAEYVGAMSSLGRATDG